MGRETEFKFLLRPAEHDRLVALLGPPCREERFENRYYTVEGGSSRRDWVLRLRVEAGGVRELTLKVGREVQPGLFESVEHSQRVESADPLEWADTAPVRALREQISTAPLRLQGEMRNLRRVYPAPIPVGERWEVDTAELPDGTVFHELEVEVEPGQSLGALRGCLEDWLVDHGLHLQASERTKYARFLLSLS